MTPTYDVAVVGAGVIGCAIASELAVRGAKVVLLERDRVCSGASGAAAGMLAPQTEAQAADPWFELLLAARAEHESLACKLRHETGIDVGYRRDGVLRVAVSAGERQELRDRGNWQQRLGLAVEWLEPEDALRLEAGLSPDLAGALWLPHEAQVQSPRLVQGLALLAQRLGVDVREGTPVVGVDMAAGRVGSLRTGAERISAGAVVLAAGVWTPFMDGVKRLPVEPVKGQIVSGLQGAGCAPRHIVWGAGAYLVPKAGGELLIGATEEAGYDARPTLGGMAGLVRAGTRLMPAIAGMPLNSAWAGLRPALPDRLPALGRLREVDGLFVATGHYRNGVLLGPLTGKLMAQLVLGEPLAHDLAPYSPARFGG
ncbi:MAG: glycine oxidase ThiO [Chloroflexota bacterium]